MTDSSVTAFEIGLRDLSPEELKLGCEEILRRATFFPAPGEVREALKQYRERCPAAGTLIEYPRTGPETPEERANAKHLYDELSRNLESRGEVMPGMDWTAEHGWQPKGEDPAGRPYNSGVKRGAWNERYAGVETREPGID